MKVFDLSQLLMNDLRSMAEEVRFELTVGANPRRFSRPVH